jgi:hypothetical protein
MQLAENACSWLAASSSNGLAEPNLLQAVQLSSNSSSMSNQTGSSSSSSSVDAAVRHVVRALVEVGMVVARHAQAAPAPMLWLAQVVTLRQLPTAAAGSSAAAAAAAATTTTGGLWQCAAAVLECLQECGTNGIAAELLPLLLPPEVFAAAVAGRQQQLGQVLQLCWAGGLGILGNAPGCYAGQAAVKLAVPVQMRDDNVPVQLSSGVGAEDAGVASSCARVVAAAAAAAGAAALDSGEGSDALPVLQLGLAAVEALLLWPAGISRRLLLHYMCNQVPGIRQADAAAAATAAAAALDKMLEAGLLQLQHETAVGTQSDAHAGCQQLPGSSSSSSSRVVLSGAEHMLLPDTPAAAGTAGVPQQHKGCEAGAATAAMQQLWRCVMAAVQYLGNQGPAGMQITLQQQLLGLQFGGAVVEAALGTGRAVGVVIGKEGRPELVMLKR